MINYSKDHHPSLANYMLNDLIQNGLIDFKTLEPE
jgi:hypothetical protein